MPKQITLIIDDDVFIEVKSGFSAHCMVGAYGIVDAFMGKLLKAINEGEKEVIFQFKNKGGEK